MLSIYTPSHHSEHVSERCSQFTHPPISHHSERHSSRYGLHIFLRIALPMADRNTAHDHVAVGRSSSQFDVGCGWGPRLCSLCIALLDMACTYFYEKLCPLQTATRRMTMLRWDGRRLNSMLAAGGGRAFALCALYNIHQPYYDSRTTPLYMVCARIFSCDLVA
jgi:hypothetical protein